MFTAEDYALCQKLRFGHVVEIAVIQTLLKPGHTYGLVSLIRDIALFCLFN